MLYQIEPWINFDELWRILSVAPTAVKTPLLETTYGRLVVVDMNGWKFLKRRLFNDIWTCKPP